MQFNNLREAVLYRIGDSSKIKAAQDIGITYNSYVTIMQNSAVTDSTILVKLLRWLGETDSADLIEMSFTLALGRMKAEKLKAKEVETSSMTTSDPVPTNVTTQVQFYTLKGLFKCLLKC